MGPFEDLTCRTLPRPRAGPAPMVGVGPSSSTSRPRWTVAASPSSVRSAMSWWSRPTRSWTVTTSFAWSSGTGLPAPMGRPARGGSGRWAPRTTTAGGRRRHSSRWAATPTRSPHGRTGSRPGAGTSTSAWTPDRTSRPSSRWGPSWSRRRPDGRRALMRGGCGRWRTSSWAARGSRSGPVPRAPRRSQTSWAGIRTAARRRCPSRPSRWWWIPSTPGSQPGTSCSRARPPRNRATTGPCAT